MTTKALNMKWDASELEEVKEVAKVFHMTITEFFKEAAKDKLTEMKNDPFYRLTHNVEDASEEETEELLNKISGLSDDDLTITSSKTITV